MSRIKKRGLDYFPINTDFMHNRLVRRILKREGDASLAVLLQTLCSIYSGEGYYVTADALFYDDLADTLYQQEPADVERIVRLAVEYGLFDARLFSECQVLTSADIQRQFLFITKRRNSSTIDPRYALLPAEAAATAAETTPATETHAPADGAAHPRESAACRHEPADNLHEPADHRHEPAACLHEPADHRHEPAARHQDATENGIAYTFQYENIQKEPPGTQSIAKESIAKQRKENPLLHSSPGNVGTEDADKMSAEEIYLRKIESLVPPQDGMKRNLDGLILKLRQQRNTPQEQYAIIVKSNFGVIGHPLWKGFYALRESRGKIRQPGRYLLSLCKPGI